MKRILLFCMLLLFATILKAQPAYPAAALNPALSRVEYFIDHDPGFGNGQLVTLPASTAVSNFQFQAVISGLTPGFHRFYIRTMDENGKWSQVYHSYFDNYAVPLYPSSSSPIPTIRKMEYFIDNDPGIGNAIEIPVTEAAQIAGHTAVVAISGLTAGVHRIFVRTQDGNGKWSLSYFAVFDNSQSLPYPAAPAPAADIQELEYFFDTDPGFGNGIPLSISPSANLAALSFDIPVAGLGEGQHHIYVRARQNPWSLSAVASFNMDVALPVTWLFVKGDLINGQSKISWATATEENTSHFVLEHSRNGAQFQDVSTVAAAGNSGSVRTYHAIHGNLEPGMHYYRIKQVDIDGKFSYSKVISLLNNDRLREATIAPNPVGDLLHLIEPVNVYINRLEIYDLNGRMIQVKSVENETKLISMPTSSLTPGQYFLKVYYRDAVKTFKILK